MNANRDPSNEATPSPSAVEIDARASSQITTGAAPAYERVTTHGQLAKAGGIGWLMAVLVFSCIALVPFVVAAIVLLGH